MMRLQTGLLLLCIILLSYAQPSVAAETEVDAVLKLFPGYHVLTLQERDSDTRAYFSKHFPKDNPSVVCADFNGDGYLDYAVLLRDGKSGSTKLVILLCSGNGQCRSVYELDETASASFVYLKPVGLGSLVSQTDAINSTRSADKVALCRNSGLILREGCGSVVLGPKTPKNQGSADRRLKTSLA